MLSERLKSAWMAGAWLVSVDRVYVSREESWMLGGRYDGIFAEMELFIELLADDPIGQWRQEFD